MDKAKRSRVPDGVPLGGAFDVERKAEAGPVLTSRWPALGIETHPWELNESLPMSNSVRRAHTGPYESSITAPIGHLSFTLAADVAARSEEASIELARFDSETGHLAAPFSSILIRSESASSSQIENLSSGARQIGLAEIGESKSENALLIVQNARALEAALSMADELSDDAVIAMHRALLERTDPDIVGSYRSDQVWISGLGLGPHEADFVPPHQSRVAEAMTDLFLFVNRTDLPPLAQIAISHAQFETIHPFPDGNGRTGRALVQAMLRGKGITRNVTVPLSAGLLSDTTAYFQSLEEFRNGNPQPIVEAFSRAAQTSIRNGQELVNDLEAVQSGWQQKTLQLRSDSSARKVLDLAFVQPVMNIHTLKNKIEVSEVSLYKAINTLVELGILTASNSDKRNRVWAAPEVLKSLDAFAVRAKRDRI